MEYGRIDAKPLQGISGGTFTYMPLIEYLWQVSTEPKPIKTEAELNALAGQYEELQKFLGELWGTACPRFNLGVLHNIKKDRFVVSELGDFYTWDNAASMTFDHRREAFGITEPGTSKLAINEQVFYVQYSELFNIFAVWQR